MSDQAACDPRSLPPNLVLDDDTLAKLMCIIIANVERKRMILRNYQRLLELLEVRRRTAAASYGSGPEGLARMLFEEYLSKQKGQEQELPQFTPEELEEMEKTIQMLKQQSDRDQKAKSE